MAAEKYTSKSRCLCFSNKKTLPNAQRGVQWVTGSDRAFLGKMVFHILDYIAMESISWSLQFQASMHPSDRVLERLTVLVRMDEQVNHFSVSLLLLRLHWLRLQKFNMISMISAFWSFCYESKFFLHIFHRFFFFLPQLYGRYAALALFACLFSTVVHNPLL